MHLPISIRISRRELNIKPWFQKKSPQVDQRILPLPFRVWCAGVTRAPRHRKTFILFPPLKDQNTVNKIVRKLIFKIISAIKIKHKPVFCQKKISIPFTTLVYLR